MEPLSAISLASNLLQFIEFGSKVIKRLYDFQESRGDVPKVFRSISIRLPLLVEDLRRCSGDSITKETENAINLVLRNCHNQMRALSEILDETLPTKTDSWAAKNKKALISIRKEKDVERIDNDIRSCIELLTFHHVVPGRDLSLHKVDSGLTLLASPGGVKCEFFEVPRKLVSQFVGREAVIGEITHMFQSSNTVVIQGMGGQGKTQIALEFCRRSRDSKAYAGIFWIEAESEAHLRRSFETIADTIKPANRILENSEQRIIYVKDYLAMHLQPWLLVLDNHDDPVSFPNVADFLPSNDTGHVLFTTRHLDVGRYGSPIALSGMPEHEALDLFFQRSQYERNDANIDHARKIVKRLGYHPLALDQAAAYISKRKRTLTLENFIDHYKKRTKDILKSTPKVWEYTRDLSKAGHKVSLSVFTTWELSFDRLVEENDEGKAYAELLNLLAYFHHGDISESMFAAFWDANKDKNTCPTWIKICAEGSQWSTDAFQDALVELCDLALIESHHQDKSGAMHASLHPLIKDWIQIRATPEEQCKQSILQAGMFMARLVSANQDDFYWFSIEEAQAAFAHLAIMEDNYHEYIEPCVRQEDIETLIDVWEAAAKFMDYNGRFNEAEKLLERAMRWCAQTSNVDASRHLQLKVLSGVVLMHRTRYVDAERIFREVEASYAAESAEDSSDRIRNLIYIAEVLTDRGQDLEAEYLYREIATRASISLGSDHLRTIMARNNLAFVLRELSNFTESEVIYRDLISLRQKQYGDSHLHTVVHYGNLAVVLADMGRFKEAETINRRCLFIRLAKDGENHPRTFNSASNLAFVLAELGAYQEAEEINRRTLQSAENVFGQGHPLAMHTLDNLAIVLLRQRKLDQAMEAAERALKSRKEILDGTHPHTLRSEHTIGLVLYAQKEIKKAKTVLLDVLRLRMIHLGVDSVFTLATIHELARVFRRAGRRSDAKRLFLSAWVKRQELLGEDHPHTLMTAVEYTLLSETTDEFKAAHILLKKAATSLETALYKTHRIHHKASKALKFVEDSLAQSTEYDSQGYRSLEEAARRQPSLLTINLEQLTI